MHYCPVLLTPPRATSHFQSWSYKAAAGGGLFLLFCPAAYLPTSSWSFTLSLSPPQCGRLTLMVCEGEGAKARGTRTTHTHAYKRKEREETVVGLLCFGRRSGATSKPMEIKDSVGRRVAEHLSNKFLPLSPCRQKTQSASTFLKSLGFSTPAPMPLPSPHSSRVATFRRLGGKEMLFPFPWEETNERERAVSPS